MTLKKLLTFLFFLYIPFLVFGQEHTIRGKVVDAAGLNPLAGANLTVRGANLSTVADSDGAFVLKLPEGRYTLRATFVGYSDQEVMIDARGDRVLTIEMLSDLMLNEVIVSSVRRDANVTNLTMGVEKMSIEEIRLLPVMMGEVDILKTIQLLPGIHTASEGSTGFSVRGGSPDQNLIVLDNTTVYNPSHQMGFFSAFNNDVISGIELYKGDFPFRHGGRLSSLLEVKTREKRPTKIGGSGGVGLISSRLMLEGPLSGKTDWLVAGRRTYADLFLVFAPDEELRKAHLYFYDLNAKMTHRFSNSDKLELNAYNGLDDMGASVGSFKYGNTAASLTWTHIFGEELIGKFSTHLSDYKYALGSDLEGMQVNWESRITDYMFRADFHQPISWLWDLSYGATVTHHRFKPAEIKMTDYDDFTVGGSDALEFAAYAGNEQKLSDRWSFKYGVRLSGFQNLGDAPNLYTTFEPGLGALFRTAYSSSVKANYSHNVQYMQLANNSSSGSPLDVWFPASKNIKPQQVDMFSLGYFHNLDYDNYELSAEVYYKKLTDVIDFREHSQLLMSANLEAEVRTGKGQAYGLELMAKKNDGPLTGFINYTLSRSERTIPEVNGGKTYLAPFDRTHALNIVATYQFNKKITASAVWVYSTGTPTTYPTGRFQIGDEYFPIYSGRNEYRKPHYDRLDLSLTYTPNPGTKKRWKGEWNFSIYNAYNKKNPWAILFNQEEESGLPYAEMLYLFGIVPSVTYNFTF